MHDSSDKYTQVPHYWWADQVAWHRPNAPLQLLFQPAEGDSMKLRASAPL
ncbi:hypothetical protein [Mumia zhuanghuii]|nr:hypothetical protein [Mumia zhuanghuii]